MKQEIINFLNSKKILIIGFGREGKSAFKFIKENVSYSELAVADKNDIEIDNIKTYTGDNYLENTKNYDIVIKSPGIIIKDYISNKEKEKITSLTDLFLRFCPNKIIGITGTKGKSTTSSLIYHILKENNYDTYLIGNIGIPCFDVIDLIKENTILVYELSCHQLEFVKASPDISVLLNLYEEHLDHYIGVNEYINAKKNIYKYHTKDNHLIYGNLSNYMNDEEINDINSTLHDIYKYSEIDIENIKTNLIGTHNKYNIITAIIATSLVGVKKEDALNAVASFNGLEHRLEFVGKFKDIKFYNDSIATACEAVISACNSIKDVNTIIIGGMERNINYDNLVDYLIKSNIENIILLPNTNIRIKNIFDKYSHNKNIILVKNMEQAVDISYKITKPNTSCLLSPAAASYGFYLNFEKRGEHFKELVTKKGN